jgi:hypothetical protein
VADLHDAGLGDNKDSDEMIFIRILTKRSEEHLRLVFDAFEKRYLYSIEKLITKSTKGYLEEALQNIGMKNVLL